MCEGVYYGCGKKTKIIIIRGGEGVSTETRGESAAKAGKVKNGERRRCNGHCAWRWAYFESV